MVKDAAVSAHTITNIMNVGEDEGTGGVVEEEGDGVAPVDKKVICYHIGQKTMARRSVLLDHCQPRP